MRFFLSKSASFVFHGLVLFMASSTSLFPVHLWTATANDECTAAIHVTTFPFFHESNLLSATADFGTPTDTLRNLTCGIATDGPGVWYHIQSQEQFDQFLQAVLTDAPVENNNTNNNNETQQQQFNTALFTGTSCDDLTCVPFSAYQLENQQTQPTSTWFALAGQSYYLHVAGIDANQVGGYTLQVTALLQNVSLSIPPNDECTRALPLENAIVVTGDSTWSRPHGLDNVACSLQPAARGLFYTVVGTGRTHQLTWTMNATTNGSFEIAVMAVACNFCVQVSDFLTAADTACLQ